MYKPNGEEPMTLREEMRRREAVAEKTAAREREESSAETLRTAFYAALTRASAREDATLREGAVRY
jgi:hypothetical protein